MFAGVYLSLSQLSQLAAWTGGSKDCFRRGPLAVLRRPIEDRRHLRRRRQSSNTNDWSVAPISATKTYPASLRREIDSPWAVSLSTGSSTEKSWTIGAFNWPALQTL